jgi:molybdopterin molybdotransferase
VTPAIGIAFADALQRLQAAGQERAARSETVALRVARGRVLARDLVAPAALPAFDNSAMDGFALRSADLERDGTTRLRLAGERFAGAEGGVRVGPGECVRITTGAAMPDGADTVAIKEHTRIEDGVVAIETGTTPGANVRRRGEDVAQGATVLQAGTTLTPAQLGLAAALGLAHLDVARIPSVAVFTTGDELRPLGETLGPGQIHDSNRVLLQSLLAQEGIDTLAWPPLPDDGARIAAALSDASQAYDLILTCGGVSAGEKDLLPELLRANGSIEFWKVMMRPGMPVLFGRWGDALFLGLPGNPVSVLATFRRLALPLLDAMQRRSDRAAGLRARLLEPVRKSHARLEFRRARLSCDEAGVLQVKPHPAAGSHQQLGAAESNALLLLPEDARELATGTLVEVEAYAPILRA